MERSAERSAKLVRTSVVSYPPDISLLQEIKAAIPKLTLEERAEVARCLHGWEDDEWDQQMKRDLVDGKLSKLLPRVDVDIAQGKFSDLP